MAIGYAAVSLPIRLVGSLLLLLLWPFLTYGLFYAANVLVEDRDLQLKTLFEGGRKHIKNAYIWGGVNILIVNLLLSNIQFYTNPESSFSGTSGGVILSSIFLTITAFWIFWQPFVVATHTHGDGGLLAAYRTTWELTIGDPITLFVALFMNMLVLFLGLLIPPIGFLISISLISLISCRTVKELAEDGA